MVDDGLICEGIRSIQQCDYFVLYPYKLELSYIFQYLLIDIKETKAEYKFLKCKLVSLRC